MSSTGLQRVAWGLGRGSLPLQSPQNASINRGAIHEPSKGVVQAVAVHGGSLVWIRLLPVGQELSGSLWGKQGCKGAGGQQVALQVAGHGAMCLLLLRGCAMPPWKDQAVDACWMLTRGCVQANAGMHAHRQEQEHYGAACVCACAAVVTGASHLGCQHLSRWTGVLQQPELAALHPAELGCQARLG